ncbi:MAG TPA: 3-oxoacyl-[acyl-carrier-protein] synthase III C-terminal domain-containing protein [Pirellulales bacterium]|nr:3-oxoacyl-[acyl-carrier-protein] synthase III C-terminal domain-containing protein [Pirellulales bacterium]
MYLPQRLMATAEQFCNADRTPVDWFLLLGGQGPELKAALQRLGLSPDRIISPPDFDGEVFTSSLAHAWHILEQSPDFTPGARVLIAQAGSGLRIAAATYCWGEDD